MKLAGGRTKISPCTLMLLSPALSSFGEEREKAGAIFKVQAFNARIVVRENLIPGERVELYRVFCKLLQFWTQSSVRFASPHRCRIYFGGCYH